MTTTRWSIGSLGLVLPWRQSVEIETGERLLAFRTLRATQIKHCAVTRDGVSRC